MLEHRIRAATTTSTLDIVLSGKTLTLHPVSTRVREAPIAAGEWDFSEQAVRVVEIAFPAEAVAIANTVFGRKLRDLDRLRQRGLFPRSCSVCGADRNFYPETAVHDEHGNLVGMTPDAPITWVCHVCDRLVCRNCTLTWPGGRQYYFHTYCSEACRTAAPGSWGAEDEADRVT
jgi:hypothetical protein